MKQSVFTICAKNYIGLAQVLERSLRRYHADLDFYIFIADEIAEGDRPVLPDNALIGREVLGDYIDWDMWEEMSFKYSLTEFCTSIKAHCFKYLFDKTEADKVIYFDPDIYAFSSIDFLFGHLDDHKILLTPHIISCDPLYGGERSESGLLSTGMYNLGFLALRKSKEVGKMLDWWAQRLEEQCYVDVLDNYFTDQRWMDFIPCFFDSKTLLITQNPGLNLAPWNFFEREIYSEEDRLYVRQRRGIVVGPDAVDAPLCFVHFSGFDYLEVLDGKFDKNPIASADRYGDLKIIFDVYRASLLSSRENFIRYLKFPYSYNFFDNGVAIDHLYRRLFRSLLEENETIKHPFSTGEHSFYQQLEKKKLIFLHGPGYNNKSVRSNISGLDGKIKGLNRIMIAVFKLVGVKRYILLLRLMRPYSRVENQLFLYHAKYNKLR